MPPTATPIPPTETPILPTATDAPTATATVSPVEQPGIYPVARGYVSMAYDEESDRVIMFGGQTGNPGFPDNSNGATWTYDVSANQWTQMEPPSGPTRRGANALAYDTESDRIILFGGADYTWLHGPKDDTWAYDYNTNTWTELAKGPADHLGPRMAYDAESDRIILFGGYDMSGSVFTDTWAYDFNSDTWTEMKPSTNPPGRNFQAMAYDATADRVLMWGGFNLNSKPVWSYDFNTDTWEAITHEDGPLPELRDYPVMVYDVESDRTILFGGETKSAQGGDDTWAYDYNTNTWTEMEPITNPGKLSRHALVYSTAADRIILFGGYKIGSPKFEYSAETWSYDLNSNTWTNVTPQP